MLYAAVTLAPLTLAGVLLASALAKAAHPAATRSAIGELRLPAGLQHRFTVPALVATEALTGLLLLTPWPATFGAGAALAAGLMIAFWLVIARALTFDPRPACACFGPIGNHRVSPRTMVRNTLLLALAALTLSLPLAGATAVGLLSEFTRSDWLWLGLTAVVTTIVSLLLAGGSPDQDRSAGRAVAVPGTGTAGGEAGAAEARIPRAVLLSEQDDVVPLQVLAASAPERVQAVVLVLLDCWCGSTFGALDRLPSWRAALGEPVVQLVFTPRPWGVGHVESLTGLWWDPGGSVFDALGGGHSPYAVALGADGLLASEPAVGLAAIDELVARLAADPSGGPGASMY